MSLVQISQVEHVPGSTLFHLWEVVQIFQRESIFYSKRSSGGSLFIEKLVPGEPILGVPFFTMTGHFRFIAGQGTEHGRVTIEARKTQRGLLQ